MNCHDIARILDEQEVGGIPAEERSAVQAHLAACGDCDREWQVHTQLLGVSIPAVPAELRALYTSQVAGFVNNGKRRRGQFVVIGSTMVVAAAAAMLAFQVAKAPTAVATGGPVQAESSEKQLSAEALPPLVKPAAEDESKAGEEWTQRVAEWLAIRDDPDALIAAAVLLMTPQSNPKKILLLLQRATALAPENPRIQATAMLLCMALKPCDTTPYDQALRRSAPNNALGWVTEVARSSQRDEKEAFRNAIAAMSRAETFDLYLNANIVSMLSQMRSALVAPPEIESNRQPISTDLIAIGAIASMPIPAFQPITKFCSTASDERALLECRQIGAAMRAGDTVLVNSIGLTISGYGLPDSAEARSLSHQRNQIKWILNAQEQTGLSEERPIPPGLFRALAENPREIDALRAFLEDLGIQAEPPLDWKP